MVQHVHTTVIYFFYFGSFRFIVRCQNKVHRGSRLLCVCLEPLQSILAHIGPTTLLPRSSLVSLWLNPRCSTSALALLPQDFPSPSLDAKVPWYCPCPQIRVPLFPSSAKASRECPFNHYMQFSSPLTCVPKAQTFLWSGLGEANTKVSCMCPCIETFFHPINVPSFPLFSPLQLLSSTFCPFPLLLHFLQCLYNLLLALSKASRNPRN